MSKKKPANQAAPVNKKRTQVVEKNRTLERNAAERKPLGQQGETGEPQRLSVEPLEVITNSIGMKFVLVPAGEFMMGSSEFDNVAGNDESVTGLPQASLRSQERWDSQNWPPHSMASLA
jgi:formylglycine-generating enzyme required for sulfatase activity